MGEEQAQGWCDAKSLIAVETIYSRDKDPEHKVTSQLRYYISSHKASNAKMPQYVRNHWGIENKLHWILDVQMHEDNDQKAERGVSEVLLYA